MSTVTNVRWIVAGVSVAGAPYQVITPEVPADWPTDEEIEAICTPNKFDLMARAIRMLIDDEDWAKYTIDAYSEERAEERRSQF